MLDVLVIITSVGKYLENTYFGDWEDGSILRWILGAGCEDGRWVELAQLQVQVRHSV
jgi:hypothetical protein